ncbi:aminomethyl-transferring glycine dehydrogenase [Myceligenerans xiligouense]|uniref:Glycine dehydrogenase (decarboxylating) n=1 Tax=Myceligenerans xiligouense TaxID=253184 RepID=A0A3N4ZBV7_9MICO|nr:aminomethyl-transferring glycine dehydrogenase [Myceligenerans xiligouense]RPF23368.1 glycine dehydrogenase (decarboxylating) alpha subunit /glycine dehydrogenase (decarboxylating) beta subunit [Myceligenerans xiligouense]
MNQHHPAPVVFADRHLGPRGRETAAMLDQLGYDTVDALVEAAVPKSIRTQRPLGVPEARSEAEVLAHLRDIAGKNQVKRQMIGQGFYDTHTPAVIRRNVLESPAWYTAYTPYQPEISQGRLEALLNFQQAVEDLTGLEIANASLLDEATAVAEAVALMWRASRARSGYVVLDADLFGQSLAVARGRAEAIGLPVVVADLNAGLRAGVEGFVAAGGTLPDGDLVGVVVQQVGASGRILDARDVVAEAKESGALVTVTTDLLALTLLVSPGELGADIAVGSAQRFGVPLFYGGPHAAYMSVRKGLERQLPGRLVGVSVDADGAPGYRLALATREQHIRRERATSNICTAQALLAIVASMYAVYHGPQGLKAIAERVHTHATTIAETLRTAGIEIEHPHFFDTIRAVVPGKATELATAAAEAGYNIHVPDPDHIQIACDETTTPADVQAVTRSLLTALGGTATTEAGSGEVPSATVSPNGGPPGARECVAEGTSPLPAELSRTTEFLQHPIFHTHRSETSLMRYLRKLSDKDLALDRTMIPLGSCTMKLNAAVEMESISWPEFAGIHPYAPADQAEGYAELISTLEAQLADITGYAAVSVQPNAGSQGEFAGLLAIKDYHRSRGEQSRDIVLIPASAHGTNAASAALAGLRVVVVRTADDGEILLDDLRAKLDEHGRQVAAIMITYPSTHGVFEEHVREVCDLVHQAGGQVYIDGANLNALVGLARPGEFGGDVSHLNLHKTFCIPHGGGGPGVGPVAVAEHLVPFLPTNPVAPSGTVDAGRAGTPISGTNHGSAGILPISYAYLALMGPDGLTEATKAAVLTANYVSSRLADHFPTLYTGPNGLVAHECILDLRDLTARTGVTAADVAKRLQDYGFHAPTLAFPVPGTLMVEPTESEDLAELDRFVDAMIAIRAEIDDVAAGRWAVEDSPLRGAPHTAASVSATEWDRPYSRETAAYPLPGLRHDKYWPPVRRIDDAHGDRNLVCSCPPVEAFDTSETRN